MRRLALFAACFAAAAVMGGCQKTGTSVSGGKALTVPADQTVVASSGLNGAALSESKDGPWVVRGTSNGRGGGDRDGREMKAAEAAPSMRFARAAKADMAPSAPGAPPPSAEPSIASAVAGGSGAALPSKVSPKGGSRAPPADDEGGAPRPVAQVAAASPLHAGSTDDNAEFAEFVKFLASWTDRPDTAGKAQLLDVRDRHFIRVSDAQGRAIPTAQVQVTDEVKDRAAWAGTTYGDGRVPFFPRVVGQAPGAAKYVVEASLAGQRGRANWDGSGDVTITLQVDKNISSPIQLDVLFAIDTTGSMQDEIDRIKATLIAVTEKLKGLKQEFDLRYGAVLYRDLGDDYVTRTYPFTTDIQAFASALQAVNAAGGGDEPESVNQALAEAVRADWRAGAAKVVFLIGDAPPHMDYQGDVPYGQSLKAAVAKGVRIHSVAASGLNPLGTLVWRQIAQFTRGKFIFIEYGSVAAAAASHGVTGAVKSNNLDDIVFEQIKDELAYWGKDAPAPNVAAQ